MARKKRPYAPKTVGCQQCLLRRIHCTREEPACQKCVKSGLECSGLNYRVEKLGLKPLPPRSTKQPCENDNSGNSGQGSGIEIPAIQSPLASQGQTDDQRIPPSQSTATSHIQGKGQEPFQPSPSPEACILSSVPMISGPGWKRRTPLERRLIWMFSDKLIPKIAPHNENAWRERVLPLAKTDDLIMTAIAFLCSTGLKLADRRSFAKRYFNQFQELMTMRKQLDRVSADGNYRTVIALLVLLVSRVSMPDPSFKVIHRMLLLKLATGRLDIPECNSESIRLFILPEVRRLHEIRTGIEMEAMAVQGS